MLILTEILENPESQKLLSAALLDLSFIKTNEFQTFLKELSEIEKKTIDDFVSILPKMKQKFGPNLISTNRLALEQASNYQLSQYKASLIEDSSVLDLCCGIGGDSLFLPKENKVIGVDLDEGRLQAFKYNHKTLRKSLQVEIKLGDVTKLPKSCDTFLLDPDRRHPDKQKHWGMEQLSPSLEQINDLVKTHQDGLIKLGPVSDLTSFQFKYSKEFIGTRSSALELCLRVGKYRLDKVLTTQLNPFYQEGHSESQEIEYQKAIKTIDEPSQYIMEPNAISLASHVHLQIAFIHKLSRLNPSIPYYTSNEPTQHPFLTSFRFLKESTFREKKMIQVLRDLDASHVEVKKRGVKQDPNSLQVLLQKKLKQPTLQKVITVFLLPSINNNQKIRVLFAERVKPIEKND